RAEYRRFAEQDHTVWSPRKVSRGIDLTRFRADNKYIYQGRGAAWFQYLETARYVARHDRLGLGDRITEDGAFGCCCVETDDGRKVSRDWLDSILEINFLEANLGLSRQPGFRVLDVGAGYGRFAHRLVEAFPQVSVCCTDAVAESTFLQEFYVKFRSIEDRVRVLTLPDAADLGPASGFQLAVSIHSFHECPIRWIDWWLRLFERCRIRYLFVVVGLAQGTVSREADGTHVDFLTHIRERGYGLLKEQPKYAGDEIATRLGLFPACYYLFDRDAME
ncbi:MAG: class I SAM-dependent methyltransferase, partial [Planctomycetota bacterium]